MMSDTTSTDAIMHEPPSNVFVFPFSSSAEYYLSKTADGTEQVREKTLDDHTTPSETTDQRDLLAVPGNDHLKAMQLKAARQPAGFRKMVRLFPDQAVSQSPTDVVSFPSPTKLPSNTNKLPIPVQRQMGVDVEMEMEEDIEISLHDDNDGLHVPPTGAHPSLQRLPPTNLSITPPPTRHGTSQLISGTGEHDLPMSYDASICHAQRERLDSDKVRPRLLRLEIDSEANTKPKSRSRPDPKASDDELLPFTPGSPDKMKGWAEQVFTQMGPLSSEPFVLEGLAQEVFTPLGPFSSTSTPLGPFSSTSTPLGPFSTTSTPLGHFSSTSSEAQYQQLGCDTAQYQQQLGCNTGPEQISPYTPFSALVTPPRRETDLWPVMSEDAEEADEAIQDSSSDGTGKGSSSDGVGIGQADDEGRMSASLAGILILGRTGIVAQKVRYSTL